MVDLHLSRNITPVLRNIVVPNGDEESSDDAYVDLHYLYGAPSVVRAMKCDSLMTDWTCSLDVGDICLLHIENTEFEGTGLGSCPVMNFH
jgi:hypothetical protein